MGHGGKRKVEPMPLCERMICLSLLVCMAVAVLSTVSLIYLTAIIYVPFKNDLEAGWEPVPVMCTSLLAEQV